MHMFASKGDVGGSRVSGARIVFLDVIKALAIVQVVALHDGLYHIDIAVPGTTWAVMVQYALRTIVEPVPLFFAVNGFLLASRRELDLRRHLRRTADLALCTLLWAVLTYVARVVLEQGRAALSFGDGGLLRAVLDLGINSPYIGPLWFMQALVALYLLYPVIWKLREGDGRVFRYVLALLFVVTCVLGTATRIAGVSETMLGYGLLSAFVGFAGSFLPGVAAPVFFFCLGCFLRDGWESGEAVFVVYRRQALACWFGCWALSLVWAIVCSRLSGATYYPSFSYAGFVTVPMVVGVFALASRGREGAFAGAISFVGARTFGIYLLHPVAISAAIRCLGGGSHGFAFRLLLTFALVGACAFATWLLERAGLAKLLFSPYSAIRPRAVRAVASLDCRRLFVALACSVLVGVATLPVIKVSFGHANRYVAVSKLIQLALVFGSVYTLMGVFHKARHDPSYRQFLGVLGAYLLLYTVLVILIWPGGWRWDDLGTFINTVGSVGWPTWQHYLTAVWYMVALVTVPSAGFIVLAEAWAIAAITAYISWRMTCLGGSRLLPWIVFVLHLLPPALNMNTYPLRAAPHAYLEVLALFLLAEHWIGRERWSLRTCLVFAFVCSLVCVWKSECAVLVPVFVFLVWVLDRGASGWRRKLALTMAFLAFFAGVNRFQQTQGSDNYALTAYVPSLPYFAARAVAEGNEGLIEELGRAYDVQVLARGYEQGVSGIAMYWQQEQWPFAPGERDEAWYEAARDGFLAGLLAYPDEHVRARWDLFESCLSYKWSPSYTHNLFYAEHPTYETFKASPLVSGPLNQAIRDAVTDYTELQQGGLSAFAWVYNPLVAFATLAVVALILSARRSPLGMLPLVLIGHSLVTFLSAPDYFYMYYYPLFVGTLFVAGAAIAWLCTLARCGVKRPEMKGGDTHG